MADVLDFFVLVLMGEGLVCLQVEETFCVIWGEFIVGGIEGSKLAVCCLHGRGAPIG